MIDSLESYKELDILNIPIWKGGSLLCTSIKDETYNMKSFTFHPVNFKRFVFKPGQFLPINLNINGQMLLRNYTISSSPARPFSITITVKKIDNGVVSNWLNNTMKVGDIIEGKPPVGMFNLFDVKSDKFVFFAAGSGITPSISMLSWMDDVNIQINTVFINSVKSLEDCSFNSFIEKLDHKHKLFSPYTIVTEKNQNSNQLLNADFVKKNVPDLHNRSIFVCGPEGYRSHIKKILNDLKFDMTNYYEENFINAVPEKNNSNLKFKLSIDNYNKEIEVKGNQTVLESLEEHGIPINWACREGVCGECKCQVVEGDVEKSTDAGLTKDQKDNQYFLACCSHLKSDSKIIVG